MLRRPFSIMDLKLLKSDDPILRQQSSYVFNIDYFVEDLIYTMKLNMPLWAGVGLAAPQVGYNLRIIVVQLFGGHLQEMINPVITRTFGSDTYKEGCLSLPTEVCEVERPARIVVKFQTQTGQWKKWTMKGQEARIVLHEVDHLDGILMTDY